MDKKLLFFDIDGTIMGFDGKIPQSTIQAISKARENGDYCIICTGRSKAQIQPDVLTLGFDGIVGATGGYVEFHDEILFHKTLGKDNYMKIIDCLKKTNAGFLVQTKDAVYLTSNSSEIFCNIFKDIWNLHSTKEYLEYTGYIKDDDVIRNFDKYNDADSIVYSASPYLVEEMQFYLGDGVKVGEVSFKEPDPYSGEITVRGITKAVGMQVLMDILQISRERVYAFGDGVNDIEMLLHAGTGIAMGNAADRAKKAADYITTDINCDGVALAMQHFGII